MLTWILTFATIPVLMLLHEGGHALSATLLGYRVEGLGIAPRTYMPYISVHIQRKAYWRKIIFMISGCAVTLVLFAWAYSNTFWGLEWLFYALWLQIAIETNPFFSDFSMLLFEKDIKENAKEDITNMQEAVKACWFTNRWYAHVMAWTLLISLLMSLKPEF
jgi:hypothetical protein